MADISTELNSISTTFERVSPKIYENTLNNNALLKWLESKGRIDNLTGGIEVTEQISVLENSNFAWQDPDTDTPTNRVDVLNESTYKWKYLYGNIVVTGAELRNNDTKHRKQNLLMGLVDNAMATVANNIGQGLFNDTTTGEPLSLEGIPQQITDDGQGVVGGIDPATYPVWSNQFLISPSTLDAVTSEQFLADMTTVFNDCTFGMAKPDLIVTTSAVRAKYEAACQEQKRFGYMSQTKEMADLGYNTFNFNGAAFIFDESCPADRMYFINTDYMGVYFHKDARMKLTAKAKEDGNDKYLWMILTQMCLTLRSRKHHGVLGYASA